MAGRGKRKTTSELDKVTLVISIIAGFAGCLAASLVYRLIRGVLWSPLAVGISFMVFAIVFIVIMCIVSMVNDNLGYHVSKYHDGGKIALVLGAVILLALILGILFEWIYEIDFFGKPQGYQEPTSYVFLIDNSGSMETSDPDGLRYQAIQKIIETQDANFPYAVYSFSNEVKEERALAPVSAGNNKLTPVNSGGTRIRGTLKTLYRDYEKGLKSQLGDAPKFLLLSDGYATDIDFFSSINGILRDYAKTPITISTVGLGDADDALMQQIADDTGGVYLSVDHVDQLEQSMQQAMKENGDNKYARTLYTYRNVPGLDFLYGIMRILFTAFLSVLISASMLFATGKGEDDRMILLSSAVTGILAGAVLELGINLLCLPPLLIRYLYYILTALTFITLKAFGGNGHGRKYTDQEDLYQTTGSRLKMGERKGIGRGALQEAHQEPARAGRIPMMIFLIFDGQEETE